MSFVDECGDAIEDNLMLSPEVIEALINSFPKFERILRVEPIIDDPLRA